MTTALLLVDIQNDYFPGGRMELDQAQDAALEARRLLAYFRETVQPVVHVQHVATDAGATFFLPDTVGVEINTAVAPRVGEVLVTKHSPNSFHETALASELEVLGVDRLVIAGMMTHMCIDSTTRAASDAGFECVVASDACATRDQTFAGRVVAAPDVHAAYMAALSDAFASVMPTGDVLEELAAR